MYKNEFKELINSSQKLYIGTGNPNSRILIIGKECAIDKDRDHHRYKTEIENNSEDWLMNIEKDIRCKDVDDWFSVVSPKYNPLYPYKGQLAKRLAKVDGVENGGTSSTWVNYQKLRDLIFSEETKSDKIIFHEDCFLTEFSTIVGRYSSCVKKEHKRESITQRSQLFQSSFFQQFPIVIAACGMDVRDYSINLEELFNVKFQPDTRIIENTKRNWYNIHFGVGDQPKLLIHTNQLSMNISNKLLEEIAVVCKDFISKYGIDICQSGL